MDEYSVVEHIPTRDRGNILLRNSLGDAQADAVAREVIHAYEEAFPQQIAGYYVEGSYADQTHLATSDLDIVLVFRQSVAREAARATASQIWAARNHASSLEVDITLTDEQQLQEGVHPNLKLGSQFLHGEDVCQNYPLLPIEAWTRERMHVAYWLLVAVYQRPTPVSLLLDFPDPTDEFYGYTNRTVHLADGQEVPCTRNLVRTTGWAATALLALQAGRYAGRKRECSRLYREQIGDEWASLLEEISTFCRDEWQYLIPTEPQARRRLRAVCERTLLFERHFLLLYKPFLLAQLRSTEQGHRRHALWVQGQLPLADADVASALQAIHLAENAAPTTPGGKLAINHTTEKS
jgi:hypothetical protein